MKMQECEVSLKHMPVYLNQIMGHFNILIKKSPNFVWIFPLTGRSLTHEVDHDNYNCENSLLI